MRVGFFLSRCCSAFPGFSKVDSFAVRSCTCVHCTECTTRAKEYSSLDMSNLGGMSCPNCHRPLTKKEVKETASVRHGDGLWLFRVLVLVVLVVVVVVVVCSHV